MEKKTVQILLAEGFPCFNKGEMAILLGMLETFQRIGNYHVRVFSYSLLDDKQRYPEKVELLDIPRNLYLGNNFRESSTINRFIAFLLPAFLHILFLFLFRIVGKSVLRIMKNPIWKAYIESDAIVFGHDGVSIVQGYLVPFNPLFLVLLSRLLRKPIVIYANGTDEIHSKLGRLVAKMVVRNVTLVTTRDERSHKIFTDLESQNPNIYYTGDPAVLAKPADEFTVKEIMTCEDISHASSPLIGVTLTREILSAYSCSKGSKAKCYEYAINEISKTLDEVVEKTNATLIFLPHSISHAKSTDDRVVHSDIQAAMIHHEKTRVIIKEYSTEDLKGLIGQMDILIGARVHSAIAALSLCVPSCVISRKGDGRADGLIGGLFNQSKWIVNIEQLKSETLVRLILDLLENADAVRIELSSITTSVRRRALSNGDLLRRVFSSN